MSNIYILEPPTTGKVVMKTAVGDIDLELWTKEAPRACRNFIQLCMEGYYDDTTFHRIVKGFIVQGGDPTGTGEGGESIYGAPFKDEFHTRLRFCRRGLLAMANSGKDDNGSQFFFTLAATPELQNKHTIFGKVTGETVFNMIKLEDALVDENDRPVYPQKILKTEILSNPFDDIVPRVNKSNVVAEKTKKRRKKGVKDFKLLSFGEEAEEDEEESVVLSKQLGSKSKSAHDSLSDPKLSSEPVIAAASPPRKKMKECGTSDPGSEGDGDGRSEEESAEAKNNNEMKERIKNKLKDTKGSALRNKSDGKVKSADNNDSEEEYYLGKDRKDERKRQAEEIKKEIRDFKREMRKEQNKKLDDEKQKTEEKKKKEISSELIKTYHETQEKYKKETSKIPKKGASREDFTLQLLNKFKNKMNSAREQSLDNESSASAGKVNASNNDYGDDDNADADADDDPHDESWMTHALHCEDKAPVLAKDASTKGDDWFEIYDPRNPLNKRRRGETSDKPKADGRTKSRK